MTRVLDGYAADFPLCRFSNPQRWHERARQGGQRFLHPEQQPRFYFPHLEATPWHPGNPWAETLEKNFEIIRDEFHGVERYLRDHPQAYLVQSGKWRTYALFRDGVKWQEHCDLCPETTRIVESLPICTKAGGLVYFSIVEPGTLIKAHCGPSNARIRHHLGIEIPDGASLTVAGETRSWKQGQCLIFDDSFMHCVQHEGTARRVVLLVDCWHPDLTEAETEFVTDIQRLFAANGKERRI